MPENKDTIIDGFENMTPEERNMQLSSALATAPYKNYNITRIERNNQNTGWDIYYGHL